ncbi:MAG: TonB-dependent receptor domain-containing protein, partial [Pseudomonadales bacterium]
VDPSVTDPLANNFLVPNRAVYVFTDPNTGEQVQAQNNRAGIDFADFDGFQNAAASLDGFNYSSPESRAAYNACVFSDEIEGSDLCAATNGLQREEFEADTTQLNLIYQLTDNVELKYIFGFNELIYRRTTDDDNTASKFHDRQFYVNHEAVYESHELVAVVDFSEDFSLTSGIYFYDATIDQRGDFYSAVGERRFIDPYAFSTAIFGPGPMTTLHGARDSCIGSTAFGCNRNDALQDPDAYNLQLSPWLGDPGTHPDLDVQWGPNTIGSDLLYHTQTQREAFAAYSQGVWQINDKFALTMGLRYARDELIAEENLWRYSETGGDSFIPAIFGSLAVMNMVNGGFETDPSLVSAANPFGVIFDQYGQPTPTRKAVNGGVPFALSIYRPFEREDTKTTFRVNLDYDINDNAMMYASVTSGHRAGGYNLVFFSNTPTYEPEELIAYEIGYKTQWMDNSLQLNGSFYYYDYENIHTVATEVSEFFGTSTSTLAAPGAEIKGIEAELTWLATDRLTLGGNFSYTPNEYTEDLVMLDPVRYDAPPSLFGAVQSATNINGNQLLQVPESKFNGWITHVTPLDSGATLMFSGSYSWIDEVYYSPFQNERDKAADYGRLDLRATWTSADGKMMLAGFVNNVLDDVGVLQVLREGESEHFRQSAGTTLPRLMGIEFTVAMNAMN